MTPNRDEASGTRNRPRGGRRTLRVEISPSILVVALVLVAAVVVLIRLAPVILVLVTALMLVGTFSPAVEWLEQRRIRRGAGIAIVFTALLVITVLIISLTIPAFLAQVQSLVDQEPALRARLVDYLAESRLTASLADALRNLQYDALVKSSAAAVFAFSTRLIEILAYSVAAIFLALYIMIDRDRLRGGLFAVVPRKHHIRVARVMLNLQTIVGGYIRGQFITCALMTVFMFILLTACGIPNPLALAVFGGVADLLPFIGIFLTMGPAVVAALAVGPLVALIVFVVMLAYEEFESRVLVPLVYGRALRLPSSIVLFALLAGATLMGVIGALLALPVAAAILMLIDELHVDLPGEDEPAIQEDFKREDARRTREYQRRTEGVPAEEAAAVALEISDRERRLEQEEEKQEKEAGAAKEVDAAKDAKEAKEAKSVEPGAAPG